MGIPYFTSFNSEITAQSNMALALFFVDVVSYNILERKDYTHTKEQSICLFLKKMSVYLTAVIAF